jgi:hypothetical protein
MVPGLYREERPGPASRDPNTIDIFSSGVCGLTVVAGVGFSAACDTGTGRVVVA